ncbi:hypothetical protein [Nostoc sp.]
MKQSATQQSYENVGFRSSSETLREQVGKPQGRSGSPTYTT